MTTAFQLNMSITSDQQRIVLWILLVVFVNGVYVKMPMKDQSVWLLFDS